MKLPRFRRSERRERRVPVLPTLLTLGNAACGFGAITYAAKWSAVEPNSALFIASCLIYLAMLFDLLDGRAARWAKQTSPFGAQLDSLCDAISFGAAPAFLMLQFCLTHSLHPRLLWMIAALYVLCTVLRLARFNVETDEDDSHAFFSGLPSPAAAGAIASFPIMVYGLKRFETFTPDGFWERFANWLEPAAIQILPFITFAVAGLMVSRIRYPHVFNQLVRGRRNRRHVIQLVFALAVIFVIPQMCAPILLCCYAFGSPLRALWQEASSRWWARSDISVANAPSRTTPTPSP